MVHPLWFRVRVRGPQQFFFFLIGEIGHSYIIFFGGGRGDLTPGIAIGSRLTFFFFIGLELVGGFSSWVQLC